MGRTFLFLLQLAIICDKKVNLRTVGINLTYKKIMNTNSGYVNKLTTKKQHAHNSNGSKGLRRALLCVRTATDVSIQVVGVRVYSCLVCILFASYQTKGWYITFCSVNSFWGSYKKCCTLLIRCLTFKMQTNWKVTNFFQANIDNKTTFLIMLMNVAGKTCL